MTNGVNRFRILSPCARGPESLKGHGAERWCPDCRKTVYDFAQMRHACIRAVCASGQACAILSYRADGSLQTADPASVPVLLRRRFLEWSAAAVLSARLAFAQRPKLPDLPDGKGGIVGLVIDAAGQPAPGARVSAVGVATYADELGRFVLAPLEPGRRVKVTAALPGFHLGHSSVAVTSGAYTGLGKIRLAVAMMGEVIFVGKPAAGSIRGKLVAAPGDPVDGWWVRLLPAAAGVNLDLRTRASGTGHFQFEHLAPGRYDLVLDASGWKARRENILVENRAVELGPVPVEQAAERR